jgi:UDP-4-amino-4-deoxy-L-arabinose formyltransferase/UDP-glucuronic acid dehydrogenase (UDP-4-keto-hexauronic acid decarboxylating)
MDPYEVDAGPIALKEYFPLTESTHIREVFDFIEARVPHMYRDAINRLALGALTFTPQPTDPTQVLRCYPRLPRDGLIDWSKPAVHLCRLVRATSEPFEGAFSYLLGERVIVWRAHATSSPTPLLAVPGQVVERNTLSGEVSVATGDGVLVLEEIEHRQHGRTIPTSVVKSSRTRLGTTSAESYDGA